MKMERSESTKWRTCSCVAGLLALALASACGDSRPGAESDGVLDSAVSDQGLDSIPLRDTQPDPGAIDPGPTLPDLPADQAPPDSGVPLPDAAPDPGAILDPGAPAPDTPPDPGPILDPGAPAPDAPQPDTPSDAGKVDPGPLADDDDGVAGDDALGGDGSADDDGTSETDAGPTPQVPCHNADSAIVWPGRGTVNAVLHHNGMAWLASDSGLDGADLAVPSAPVFVRTVPSPGLGQDLAAIGPSIFLADLNGGLRVADVAVPPLAYEIASFDTGGAASSVVDYGDLVLVADEIGGLWILDVLDPSSPNALANLDVPGGAWDVDAESGYAYLATVSSELHVVDLADPSAPSLVATLGPPTLYATAVSVQGDYLYVASGSDGLTVVAVSDPTAPEWVSTTSTFGPARELDVVGTTAFVANYGAAGLRSFDVSSPAAPSWISYFAGGTPDARAVHAYPPWALLAYGNGGAQVLTNLDTKPMTHLASIVEAGRALEVVLDDQVAWVADRWSLRAIDVSDASFVKYLGEWQPGHLVLAVELAGSTAYVARQALGVSVVDLSNPLQPEEIGSWDGGVYDQPHDLRLVGDTLFVANDWGGLLALDVSNPLTPTPQGTYDLSGGARSLDVEGDIAYVAGGSIDLCVLDVSDPTTIQLLDALSWAAGDRVEVAGDLGFVSRNSEVLVLDVSDPGAIQELATIPLPEAPGRVTWAEGKLWVATGSEGILTYDLTDPAAPVLTDVWDTFGRAAHVLVEPKHLFVADGSVVLHVIDRAACQGVSEQP